MRQVVIFIHDEADDECRKFLDCNASARRRFIFSAHNWIAECSASEPQQRADFESLEETFDLGSLLRGIDLGALEADQTMLLLASFFVGSTNAEEVTFYQKDTDSWWSVTGGAVTETGQATCYGTASKKDGSFIQIHRSLVDGEVWAIMHSTAWEIGTQDSGALRWNFSPEARTSLSMGLISNILSRTRTPS